MASRVRLICLAFLAILLSACDSAEDLVNRRLPPVPVEQHRAAVIQAAQTAIAGLDEANAGFSLRIEDIAATLNASGFAERLGVGQLKLRGDRQLILAEMDVARTFSDSDFPELDENTKRQIAAMKPEIKGRITFGLGLASSHAPSEDGRVAIGLRLLPLFRNVEVERLALTGELDVDVVVTMMNRLADRVSYELSRSEVAKVSFPTRVDLAFKNADGVQEKITATEKPVSSPVIARSEAWLVDADSVTFIAELAPVGTPAGLSSGNADYAQLRTEFTEKLMQGLGVADAASANWVAVSKKLVASLVNGAVEQRQPCIKAKAVLPGLPFSNKVEIPDNTEMDCTPRIDCTPRRDCGGDNHCVQADDCKATRDCQVCALGACFNDPACERIKANTTYNCEVRRAARKLECERIGAPAKAACETERAAEQASCETQKSSRRLTCEAGRQGLEKVAGTGTLANLAGAVGGSVDISICIKNFAVNPSLERLEAWASIGGEGAVDLGIKYIPEGIAGYFTCHFPWTEDKHIKVMLTEQSAKIDAALVLDGTTSDVTLRADIKTSALAAPLRPNPRDLLLESYAMRTSCAPVDAMLHEMTLDVTQSVPKIDGDFKLPGEGRALVLTLEPATFLVGGTNVVAKSATVSNSQALILNDDRSSVPAN
jgi:hypothetical protein